MVSSDRELNIKFVVDADGAIKAIKGVDDALGGVEDSGGKAAKGLDLTKTAAVAGAAAVGVATLAFTALAKTASAALARASEIEGVTAAFQQFESQGKLAADSLGGLQDATKGLVSDFDLMQQANQAVLLGVADGSGKFQDMASAAVKLGEATGRTATEALSDLVTGIGRASPLILDNLGITVSAAEAQELYAAQLKKSTDQLTETEKKEAFRAAALIKIKEATSELNDVEITAAKGKQQLNVQTQNLIDKFSIAFSKNKDLGSAFGDLSTAMEKVPAEEIGRDLAAVIEVGARLAAKVLPALVDGISDFTRGLRVLANFVELAKEGEISWAAAIEITAYELRAEAKALEVNKLRQEKLREEREKDLIATEKQTVATGEQAEALNGVAEAADKVIKKTTELSSLNPPQIVGANRLPAVGGVEGIGPIADGAAYGEALGGGAAAIAYQAAQDFSQVFGDLIAEAFADGIQSDEWKSAISGVVGSASGPFAPITTAVSDAVFDGLKGAFDGNKNAEANAREAVDAFLADAFSAQRLQAVVNGELQEIFDFDFGGRGGFDNGAGFGFFNTLPDDARRSFEGVGQALAELLGVTEDIGGQIGAVFATNLGGDLFNLKLAVEATGFSIDEMGDALVQSALKGELSFLEVQSALQGLGAIAEDGVPGQIGAIDVAFEKMKESGTLGGKATTEALKAIAAEALELGITTIPGLQQALIDAGATERDVAQIAEAMNEAEVSVEDLARATDQKLIQVLADLESQGFAFADKAGDQIDGLIAKMERIPKKLESEFVIRARTEAQDSIAQEFIDRGEGIS